MKVLLLGEFSGFHNNLKQGLEELGHQVVLAASGDGFKQLKTDIDLGSARLGIAGTLERIIKSLKFAHMARGFDVVQLINPNIFPTGFGLNSKIISRIIKNNSKMFLSACGDDFYYVTKGCSSMRYSPIPDALIYDYKSSRHPYDNENDRVWLERLSSAVAGVIPVVHEYVLGYRHCDKLRSAIPLPINTRLIEYSENVVKEKLVVFHGLNRYGFKGTRFVEQAFDYLRAKYPDELELVIAGGLPLEQYLKLMQRTNVVIDQVSSYSCGMNALYALAMGKVVLGGAEPEGLAEFGIEQTPVINITPSTESIILAIENLLASREEISALGAAGRCFVEQYHSHIKIAEWYVKEWSLG
jgi:hypothetical protein